MENKNLIEPIIVLVRPQLGENIGSVARVMLNFGLKELRIVNPRDGWPNLRSIPTSAGAEEIIENAKIYNNLSDSISDISMIYATSIRSRDMNKQVIDPREFANELSQKKTAILFGAENNGLSNEEITSANKIIAINVNPNFSSLNLAQAVGIICYECFSINKKENVTEDLAVHNQIKNLIDLVENKFIQKKYFKDENDKNRFLQNIVNIFKRIDSLTNKEVNMLYSIIKD